MTKQEANKMWDKLLSQTNNERKIELELELEELINNVKNSSNEREVSVSKQHIRETLEELAGVEYSLLEENWKS